MRPTSLHMTRERRAAIAATRIGVPLRDYLAHLDAGERWCCGHRGWHPIAEMSTRTSKIDGLDNICKRVAVQRALATQRRRRERERAS